MDHAPPQGLTPTDLPVRQPTAPSGCSRCGEPWPELPGTETSLIEGGAQRLLRCGRCGTRHALGPAGAQPVRTCGRCGVPCLVDDHSLEGVHCGPCSGSAPAALDPPGLGDATEAELLQAVAARWTLLGSEPLDLYLDRLCGALATRIGAPDRSRVVVFDDPALRCLALPSGLVLVSLGTLLSLKDEAELAFVLGHELAHAASPAVGSRVARLALRVVASTEAQGHSDAWLQAVQELTALGHGREEELRADAAALDALIELGYDPDAALRYLRRLAERIAAADPALAALGTAHPAPVERRRRLQSQLSDRVLGGLARRINRELFRRAAGRQALESLTPVETLPLLEKTRGAVPGGRRLRWLWLAFGVAGLTGLFLLVGRWLS